MKVLKVLLQFEDGSDGELPKVSEMSSLGNGGEVHPDIRVGKEYTIKRGGTFTHYTVVDGVEKVRVITMRMPTLGIGYDELVLVQNLTPKGPTSPTNFWISPEDLEAIPPVAVGNFNKPAVPPPLDEEAPEDGSHPAGYGV